MTHPMMEGQSYEERCATLEARLAEAERLLRDAAPTTSLKLCAEIAAFLGTTDSAPAVSHKTHCRLLHGDDFCSCGTVTADARKQALDALLREGEALGLYNDERKP